MIKVTVYATRPHGNTMGPSNQQYRTKSGVSTILNLLPLTTIVIPAFIENDLARFAVIENDDFGRYNYYISD